MKRSILLLLAALLPIAAWAETPERLVTDGVPPIAPELQKDAARYMEFRSASFQGWHPSERQMLITTRFAQANQLHLVRAPGAARKQLTFLSEPVLSGKFRPRKADCIVFAQDSGGSEFYQLYRYDVADGRVTLLTDGKSRHTGMRWARSGKRLAYTSTQRTGEDNDIWIIDPSQPDSARMVLAVKGGGWTILDWSHDEKRLLLAERISANETRLHALDLQGSISRITPGGESQTAYGEAQFAPNDKTFFVTTDRDSEFQRLVEMDLGGKIVRALTEKIGWDVEQFDLSPDGASIAFSSNEDGASVLRIMDVKSGRERKSPKLPMGVVSRLEWHENGRDLGFGVTSARSPEDAWSYDTAKGELSRWTESETGGLNAERFAEPELVKLKSYDGLQISAFVYRPDAKRFPGKRPVIISIHGGPESQTRPVFQARNNFYLNELGIAMVYPNVRGSAGYGKTFLTLDNGFKREDSVRDIAAALDFIGRDSALDASRVAVAGGSYGGFMSLACMAEYADRLRCGVDVVGISNFLTFLKNTQAYRRDLRRVEYGDEREPKMAEFLDRIAPTARVKQMTKPLFVIQGRNDPRVPASESEQMVKAIRGNGGTVWYLLAEDEGHGFQKKKNIDFQFLSTIEFYREFLLK